MMYQGGKAKLAGKVAGRMLGDIVRRGSYVEPFCGACSVALEVAKYCSDVRCSDANEWLIHLWNDRSFVPSRISEYDYEVLMNTLPMTSMTAFAGCFLSYSGSWFAGYARGRDRDFFDEAQRSLSVYQAGLRDVVFECRDFDYDISDSVIYCDPPYAGTKEYSVEFNRDAFIERVLRWSLNNVVYVSELWFEVGVVVAEWPYLGRTERLYKIGL